MKKQNNNRFFGQAFSRKKGLRVKGSALVADRSQRNPLTSCAPHGVNCKIVLRTVLQEGTALQERASPYPVVTSASSIRTRKGGLKNRVVSLILGISGRSERLFANGLSHSGANIKIGLDSINNKSRDFSRLCVY